MDRDGELLVGADEGQGRGRESDGSRDAAPEETGTAWSKERDRVIPGHPRYAHSISFARFFVCPPLSMLSSCRFPTQLCRGVEGGWKLRRWTVKRGQAEARERMACGRKEEVEGDGRNRVES